MRKPKQLLCLTIIIFFLSCKNDHSLYTHAIRDTRASLRPHLTKIVSKGIVMYYDSSLRHMATDNELLLLSHSEHPILRASAFREMLHRKSFDHFNIVMDHLDDTAVVQTDGGEFGIWSRTVSDDILQEAGWQTKEKKNKTIEKVLSRHNYLRSAYTILLQIEPEEKYYSFIKDMATRPRFLSEDGYELRFSDIEFALYGLAKFKKQGDLKIIKTQMLKQVWQLSETSFNLMKRYPDTTYFDVLQTYHRRQFYKFSGNRPGGFSGYSADRAAPEDFIKALVIQQSDKGARLLDTILNQLALRTCMPDKESIIDNIVMEIWEHPCPAYEKLRNRIKDKAEQMLKDQISISVEPFDIPVDSTEENIWWFR
jgi:hypothetical protein